VICQRLWEDRFGRESSLVGRAVRVNGRDVIIVGVAPRDFVGAMHLVAANVWLPAAMYPELSGQPATDRVPMFGVVGRLNHAFTREQARADLDIAARDVTRLTGRLQPLTTMVEPASGFGVPPAVRNTVMNVSALLLGLVALLVAVAVANVAALLLVRSAGRQKEIGTRLALGASPSRIVRQLLTESVVLALAGGIAGLPVAWWTTRIASNLGAALPDHLSYAVDIQPDSRVLVYAFACAILTAAIFGVAPARRSARTDVVTALKQAAGGTPAGTRTLKALVVGQVALSMVLLSVGGLLAQSYMRTLNADPGFDTSGIVVVTVDVNQIGMTPEEGRRFYGRLLDGMSRLPGLAEAALASVRPLAPSAISVRVRSVGAPGAAEGDPHDALTLSVTPGYFDTLSIRMTQGKGFGPLDTAAPAVAIVNETMAQRLWPGESPIGRTFTTGERAGNRIEVIGVAADVKYRALSDPPRAVFYRPLAQEYAPQMTVIARARSQPAALLATVREYVRTQDSDLAPVNSGILDELVSATRAPGAVGVALSLMAILGLLLASVGLYGVIAYVVRLRAREIAIRIALGARTVNVVLIVCAQGLAIVAAGVALGTAGSLAAWRVVGSLMYGVGSGDPVVLAAVCLVVAAVSFGALYLPARWAARISPARAQRVE
jgi:predicted permease